jgi:3-dehydroquinate synthase
MFYTQDKAEQYLTSLLQSGSYDHVVILTDEAVKRNCLRRIPVLGNLSHIVVPEGESAKNLETVTEIWQQMHNRQMTRSSLLINIGGGVITDLGGFCASTYMRGIDCIHIPTTTLAMVDAAVGGKTGFNTDWGKNMLGTFHSPKAILYFPEVLKTLDERHFLSGVTEAFKTAVMVEEQLLNTLRQLSDEGKLRSDTSWIIPVAEAKQQLVDTDYRETGNRIWLNFGHTIGHAFEHYLLQRKEGVLLHGEAVAWGMLAEMYIVDNNNAFLNYWEMWVKKHIPQLALSEADVDALLVRVQSDKKQSFGRHIFTVPEGLGRGGKQMEADIRVVKEKLTTFLHQYSG